MRFALTTSLPLFLGLCLAVTGCAVGPNHAKAEAGPLLAASVPMYPGAEVVELKESEPSPNGSKRVSAVLSTGDDYEKVVSFYRNALHLQEGRTGNTVQFLGPTPNGSPCQILVQKYEQETKVTMWAIVGAPRP